MKKLIFCLSAIPALLWGCAESKPAAREYESHAAKIVAEIHNPASKYVVVISHRGDWRNYPENSIPAIESVIRMGVDIMELDLKMTRDSVLVLCHDHTIDRTTTGRGRVSEITYDSIQRCFLRTAHGVKTVHKMPTLREALAACKDRIVVNIDQGYEYYDLALKISEELGVTDQMLIKGKRSVDAVAAKFGEYERNMMYMPIIDILKPQGRQLFAEYRAKGVVPLAYEVCWDKYTPEVRECMQQVVEGGSKLWVNSLWESLCGGLCDDVAWEKNDPDGVYGKLLEAGATMIQTDRADLLLKYLRSKGRHD
ncbi:glycerophosphodiester phosphodiesterase family protein [uncultured Alistipes sp.]|jgi:glycerophosphodiester phosphodiesterase|uniref:glycerophosphodiester phosphodiesterase family protein n=1 Tax=uncultured Alistipes sp. TaxID=538949 RepID=UPI0025FFE58D|nr:glycerophosphodiester phosphodiesterase family protein [uncultured Alistipes sp.]